MSKGVRHHLTEDDDYTPLGQLLSEMHSEEGSTSPSSAVAESSVQAPLGDGFLLLNKIVREKGHALVISMTTNERIGIFELADEDEEAECIGEGDTLAEAIRDVVPF